MRPAVKKGSSSLEPWSGIAPAEREEEPGRSGMCSKNSKNKAWKYATINNVFGAPLHRQGSLWHRGNQRGSQHPVISHAVTVYETKWWNYRCICGSSTIEDPWSMLSSWGDNTEELRCFFSIWTTKIDLKITAAFISLKRFKWASRRSPSDTADLLLSFQEYLEPKITNILPERLLQSAHTPSSDPQTRSGNA